jgi:hypothetical protein
VALLRRRRPLNEWSFDLIRKQIVSCFTSDPDDEHVRAVVVLHQDEALLPKDAPKLAAAEAGDAGEPFEGIPPYMAFAFGFNDDDRTEIFMGGDMTTVVREWAGFKTPTEAERYAAAWCGEGAKVFDFENIPGLYQAAFMEFITGKEYDLGPLTFAWTLPAVGDYGPCASSQRDLEN